MKTGCTRKISQTSGIQNHLPKNLNFIFLSLGANSKKNPVCHDWPCRTNNTKSNEVPAQKRHITIVHEKNGAEANGSGNGSAQNREESAGDRKQKNEDEKDSMSKKAKLDEDDDGIVCLDDDIEGE